MEGFYPRTPGRFGGNGLLHDRSSNAQKVDHLLCAVLHPLRNSPGETGRIHAVPGSGVDGAAGAKHDDGRVGIPERRRYLLHDRDTKFCQSFRELLKTGDVNPLRLPARSPNLNSYAERWVRSVKEECLTRLILIGESSLRRALHHYVVWRERATSPYLWRRPE